MGLQRYLCFSAQHITLDVCVHFTNSFKVSETPANGASNNETAGDHKGIMATFTVHLLNRVKSLKKYVCVVCITVVFSKDTP